MDSSEKKIQIEMGTFLDVYRLILALQGYKLDSSTKELCERLDGAFNAKLDAMEKRKLYTQSKTALTEEDRDQARQKYLDLVGMNKDFRYSQEYIKKNPS